MWAPAYPEQYPEVTPEQVEQARAVWGQYLDTSPDGVHWTRRPRRLLPMRHGDYMMVTRDERNGRWWLNERALNLFGRNAALRTSSDLVHWTDPAEMAVFNQPDSGFGHAYEWHGGITPFNYGNLNLGFLERWCNAGYGDGCELVSNRDGQPWQRVCPGTLFLDTGPAGSFDRVLVYPTHNAPIENGEKIFLFYTGGAAGTGAGMPMAMGLMWIMRDRFAGMAHSRREPGELLTKPLRIERDKLEVNAERLFAGAVQVGVRRTDGGFIDGYGTTAASSWPAAPAPRCAGRTRPTCASCAGRPCGSTSAWTARRCTPTGCTDPPARQPAATSNAVTLRVCRLNSTPIRWIGSPRPRYFAA